MINSINYIYIEQPSITKTFILVLKYSTVHENADLFLTSFIITHSLNSSLLLRQKFFLDQICIVSLFGQNIMTFYFIGYHIYYLAFTQTFHTWSICVGGGGICFGIKSGFVVTL